MSASSPVLVRPAEAADMAGVTAIYTHHVLNGRATFEEVPPSREEMSRRREAVLAADLPYLVAIADGEVLGYSYATAYRPRSAYRFTIEDSVYVRSGLAGRGIGRTLLQDLIRRCEDGPWRQMIAVIGDSENSASIALHRALGFEDAGVLRAVGLKFGHWVDTVQMQRAIGDGATTVPGGAAGGPV